MKGIYRCYVKRLGSIDWEIVGSSAQADEAHAMALHWEQTSAVYEVRLDVCVRYLATAPASTTGSEQQCGRGPCYLGNGHEGECEPGPSIRPAGSEQP